MVDDLGFMDIGANNPDCFYETPNIDRLAASGIRFTNGYAANPVCSPGRTLAELGTPGPIDDERRRGQGPASSALLRGPGTLTLDWLGYSIQIPIMAALISLLAGLLLGSTSTYVVHHAPCPVVVVPHDED